jgi:hypothetical protein
MGEFCERFYDNTTKIKILLAQHFVSSHFFQKIILNMSKNRFLITLIARYTAFVVYISNTRIVILNLPRDVYLRVCVCVCVCVIF